MAKDHAPNDIRDLFGLDGILREYKIPGDSFAEFFGHKVNKYRHQVT